MWTRAELKARGKVAFKENYWRCVLVALILVCVGGGIGAAGGRASSAQNLQYIQEERQMITADPYAGDVAEDEELDEILGELGLEVAGLGFGLPLLLSIGFGGLAVMLAFSAFLINPLILGCERFFSENSRRPVGLGELGYGFKKDYLRVVKTMFLKDLFLVLWSCLFLIPGIIKSYSYRMVPYILAQEPEMGAREAIDRSRAMMDGHKWRAFLLDLSFIGWIFLSAITMGIVGIFYVFPYIEATNAELYYALSGGSSAGYTDWDAPL